MLPSCFLDKKSVFLFFDPVRLRRFQGHGRLFGGFLLQGYGKSFFNYPSIPKEQQTSAYHRKCRLYIIVLKKYLFCQIKVQEKLSWRTAGIYITTTNLNLEILESGIWYNCPVKTWRFSLYPWSKSIQEKYTLVQYFKFVLHIQTLFMGHT